jgi:hypothetical protein
MVPLFPSAIDDLLIQIYPCVYSPTDGNSPKGQLMIGRNAIYFTDRKLEPGNLSDPAPGSDTKISILYRDVNSLEYWVPNKKVSGTDYIQIGTKEQQVFY